MPTVGVSPRGKLLLHSWASPSKLATPNTDRQYIVGSQIIDTSHHGRTGRCRSSGTSPSSHLASIIFTALDCLYDARNRLQGYRNSLNSDLSGRPASTYQIPATRKSSNVMATSEMQSRPAKWSIAVKPHPRSAPASSTPRKTPLVNIRRPKTLLASIRCRCKAVCYSCLLTLLQLGDLPAMPERWSRTAVDTHFVRKQTSKHL